MNNIENDFIKDILHVDDLNKEDCDFLMEYIQLWLTDSEIDVSQKTIEMLNKHKDNIERLKLIYAKDKIMDLTERKIILSRIANGDIAITKYKINKFGEVIPYVVEPSFNERITAINALNTLDQLESLTINDDRKIIIDDIPVGDINEEIN